MTEPRPTYITTTQPVDEVVTDGRAPMLITGDDWRYNMLLRLEQRRQAGLMLLVDPDARCWFEVGRMECNKADRDGLPFKM